jgi:hypothetical protein
MDSEQTKLEELLPRVRPKTTIFKSSAVGRADKSP